MTTETFVHIYGMDKHYFRSDSGSDSSGEFYDNPFFVEDDKFEREFEKTLALFDALLIGEDSQSDSFSLSSSPSSTLLKLEPLRLESHAFINPFGNKKSATVSRFGNYGEVGQGERPQSFLYDEVTEFNRLLKELSDTPLMSRCCPSVPCRPSRTCDDLHLHQHRRSSTSSVSSGGEEGRNTVENSTSTETNGHPDLIAGGEIPDGPEDSSIDRAATGSNEAEAPFDPRSCPDCQRRASCLNILESGFFDSLRAVRPSSPVGSLDRRGFSLHCRNSSRGLRQCQSLRSCGRLASKKEEADSAYQTGSSDTLKSSTASLNLLHPGSAATTLHHRGDVVGSSLAERLSRFNENKYGLYVEQSDGRESAGYRGTIRVHLNLIQPISMRLVPPPSSPSAQVPTNHDDDSGGRGRMIKHPSSLCNLNSAAASGGGGDGCDVMGSSSGSSLPHSLSYRGASYASFYLPPDISKVIHVTSESTTTTVIKILLNKFQIVNNSSRFALFLRTYDRPARCNGTETGDRGSRTSLNLTRPLTCHMRRLTDEERPLDILLRAVDEAGTEVLETIHFVLQEYSSGEIIWEAFSIPELNNFLTILDIEERLKLEQLEQRYAEAKAALCNRIEELQRSTAFKRP